MALWTALVSLHIRCMQYQQHQASLRYRLADDLSNFLDRFPRLSRLAWRLLLFGWHTWKRVSKPAGRRRNDERGVASTARGQ
jgi:hypothetical protein